MHTLVIGSKKKYTIRLILTLDFLCYYVLPCFAGSRQVLRIHKISGKSRLSCALSCSEATTAVVASLQLRAQN